MLNGFLATALASSRSALASFFGASVAYWTVGALDARFSCFGSFNRVTNISASAVIDLKAATTAITSAFGETPRGFGGPPGCAARVKRAP